MSEHRIACTLRNFEMEQTIIRLRNTRNRLLDRNNGKFPGAEAIETYRDEIRRLESESYMMKTRVIEREEKIEQYESNYSRLERENASLADRLSGAELERDRLGAELEAMKLYVACLEDSMTPEALRFAQAGFDIGKAKIKIAG